MPPFSTSAEIPPCVMLGLKSESARLRCRVWSVGQGHPLPLRPSWPSGWAGRSARSSTLLKHLRRLGTERGSALITADWAIADSACNPRRVARDRQWEGLQRCPQRSSALRFATIACVANETQLMRLECRALPWPGSNEVPTSPHSPLPGPLQSGSTSRSKRSSPPPSALRTCSTW